MISRYIGAQVRVELCQVDWANVLNVVPAETRGTECPKEAVSSDVLA